MLPGVLLTGYCTAIPHDPNEDGGDAPSSVNAGDNAREPSDDRDEEEPSEDEDSLNSSDDSDSLDSSDGSDDSDHDVPLAKTSRQRKKKARPGRTSKTGNASAARHDDEGLERGWAAMKISSALRDSVEELQGKERRRRLVDITQATEFDLAREEQIAANHAKLRRIMNGEPAVEQPVRPIEPPAPEDSDPPLPLEPITTSSHRSDELATSPMHAVHAPVTSLPPVLPGTMHAKPSAHVGSSASATIHFFRTANPDGWPDWLNIGYTHLSDAHLGEEYEAALVAWTELERAYEWENVRILTLVLCSCTNVAPGPWSTYLQQTSAGWLLDATPPPRPQEDPGCRRYLCVRRRMVGVVDGAPARVEDPRH